MTGEERAPQADGRRLSKLRRRPRAALRERPALPGPPARPDDAVPLEHIQELGSRGRRRADDAIRRDGGRGRGGVIRAGSARRARSRVAFESHAPPRRLAGMMREKKELAGPPRFISSSIAQ